MNYSICHISTVHSRYDDRIFLKECLSLVERYEVSLIIADGLGDESKSNISIYDIGIRQDSRLKRMRIDTKKAYIKALDLDCHLYHIHDPELIPIAYKLKKKNKVVIYDTHEDLPRQIQSKPYINKFSQPFVSLSIELYENFIARKLDCIITATPFIKDRFIRTNKNSVDINNYPIIGELLNPNGTKKEGFCYTGGISEIRGIYKVVEAFEINKMKLTIAGSFEDEELKRNVEELKGWKHIKYLGQVERIKVGEVLSSSLAGIVTYLPYPNHIDSQPVKMFEYMSAGLTVIASDYPLWQQIIEKNNCGLCVNPLNPKEIAKAVLFFKNNPGKAIEMGNNGINMIKTKYNWGIEEKKLLNVYKSLLNDN